MQGQKPISIQIVKEIENASDRHLPGIVEKIVNFRNFWKNGKTGKREFLEKREKTGKTGKTDLHSNP